MYLNKQQFSATQKTKLLHGFDKDLTEGTFLCIEGNLRFRKGGSIAYINLDFEISSNMQNKPKKKRKTWVGFLPNRSRQH
jgi:hypothetical protein